MQILPISETTRNAHEANYRNAKDGLDFARLFNELTIAAPAEITPVLDADPDHYRPNMSNTSTDNDESALETEVQPAPYVEHPTVQDSTLVSAQADTTPTSEIKLTPSEVKQLVEDLHKQDVNPEVLAKLEEAVNTPQGLTIGKAVEILMQQPPAKLTQGDLVRIESLSNKIDPTGALAKKILPSLKEGNIAQGWADFFSALQASEAGPFDIEKSEIVSLGKALKLNPATLDALGKSFGQGDSLKLSGEGLKNLLVPMQSSMNKFMEDQQKIMDALEAALPSVISKARSRLQNEASAALAETKQVFFSQTLIKDTVTQKDFVRQPGENVRDAKDANSAKSAQEAKSGDKSSATESKSSKPLAPATGQEIEGGTPSVANAGKQGNGQASVNGQAGASVNGQASASADGVLGKDAFLAAQIGQQLNNTSKAENLSTKLLGSEAQPHNLNGAVAAGDQKTGNGADLSYKDGKEGNDPKNSKDNLGQSLLQTTLNAVTTKKVETPANPWESMLNRLNSATGVNGTANVAAGATAANAGTAANAAQAPLSARVLSQVEAGMFTAMRDGTKKLELHLNPMDLGVVSVLLSSRNGEVSATLRPERPETAAMLLQQMDQLKANLEEQGLKVDKVDVQTGLKDGAMWGGTQEHNSSQEQQARTLELERFKRLGRLRQDGGGGDSGLITTQSLRQSSQEGLHLVA